MTEHGASAVVTPRPPRFQPLYHTRAARGRRGKMRHLFRAAGIGLSSVCQDAMFTAALTDDTLLPPCPECLLLALTELSLAIDSLGLADLAVRVAAHARDVSYETERAQSA